MDSIAARIKELIETLHLSNADFAKQTKLNPATVSHILSGRNKASLQVIENIKTTFTNVNIDYLITGHGELFSIVTNVTAPASTVSPPIEFPTEGVRVASVGATPLAKEEPTPVPPEATPKVASPAPLPATDVTSEDRAIERIVIFYADGSFSSYRP